MKKKGFNLKEEYKFAWKFLVDSREFIYIAILVFFIFAALGFFFEDLIDLFFRAVFSINLNDKIVLYLKDILEQTVGMNQTEITGFIFVNNLQSSFMGLVFGIAFGVFPLFALVLNGYLLGFVAMLSVKTQGIFVLWRILPHGVFELPAIFISLGLGLRLGLFLFRNEKKMNFKQCFFHSLKTFLIVVFPLLVIAAIIEGLLIAFSGA